MNQTTSIINQAQKENRKALLEPEAKTICSEYGISVNRFKVATTEAQAAVYADEIGYPIVLKIVSPDISHKSDAGGVLVNLKPPPMLPRDSQKSSPTPKITKLMPKLWAFLCRKWAPSGIEVIVGSNQGPDFWPHCYVWLRRDICRVI
jgi:acyl-CoA synthetase (NDP forming)